MRGTQEMMIKESARIQINNELKSIMPQHDILKLLDIFDKLLQADCPIEELRGIKDRCPGAINSIFNPDSNMNDVKGSLSDYLKLEAVFKLILYYINPDKYEDRIKNIGGFAPLIRELDLNRKNEDLSKSRELIRDERFLRQIANAYKLRNTEAHACRSWSRNEIFQNVNDVMVSILFCISIHRRDIQKNLALASLSPLARVGVDKYMGELISYFKNKMRKYIDLNGEENLDIVNRFVVETNSDDSNEESNDCENQEDEDILDSDVQTPRRMGTIDEIRKNSLKEKRMIIWGEAGTGKSTTLEYLAYIDALDWKDDNKKPIPVLIPLGILTSLNESVLGYIAHKLSTDESTVVSLLESGRFNLFIDGINEIPRDHGYHLQNLRMKEIKSLLEQHPENQFIISNRPSEAAEFKDVPVFLLMKLSDEQIRIFLEKNTKSQDTIDIINAAMEENERLKNIVRTPLMFSRLIDIVDFTGTVPTSEGKIIGAFLDTLFQREKNEKMDAVFDVRKANYLLRTIAYQGLEDASTNAGMTEETILSYMKYCMQNYCFQVDSIYMLELFVQLGVLIRRDDLYVFAHQAYQDYYHAEEEWHCLKRKG